MSRTITRSSQAGAQIVDIPFSELAEIPEVSVNSGICGAEAYALHYTRIAQTSELIDLRVRVCITGGVDLLAVDYIDICRARGDIMARSDAETAAYGEVLMPTAAVTAPLIDEVVASEDLCVELKALCLRNATAENFLNRCVLTIPCHALADTPVGL